MLFKLEGLHAWTSYDLRFASSNEVGVSPWSEYLQITLPRPRVPDKPVLYLNGMPVTSPRETFIVNNSTVNITWDAPEHNGAHIDYYELAQVILTSKRDLSIKDFEHSESDIMHNKTISVARIPIDQKRIFSLQDLQPESLMKLILRAHNIVGYSESGIVLLSTSGGKHVWC